MIEIRQSDTFADWLADLRDKRDKARITARIARLIGGNFGDAKSVGGGVSELRLHFGPGYRVYFAKRGDKLVILLCGCAKSTQSEDIALAQTLALTIQDGTPWH